jgi:hypothetical protein
MDNSQFVLQGERRQSNHPHTRNVHQQEITPKSIHRGVVGPSPLLSFGMVAIVKQGAVPNITRVELIPFWYTRAQWQLQYPKDVVYKSDITWANTKKSAGPDILMKYCPSWAAPKKKGCPKKDARKLGIVDYVKQGVAKRRHKNPIAPETATKEVHKNTEQMRVFNELKLNQFGDSKDGLVGNALIDMI